MVVVSLGLLGAGQLPLAPAPGAGQSVTPALEGWYENPDGTYSLSFGYFNRNTEEELDIPIGPNNRFEPGTPDRGQPTHFLPRRQRGAFTVTVPADVGDRTLTWTLVSRGQTLSVPGHMLRDWQLDALEGAASGNTPPVLKFDSIGPEGTGPGGIYSAPLTVTLPYPVMLTVWRTDPEPPAGGRGGGPATRGDGDVGQVSRARRRHVRRAGAYGRGRASDHHGDVQRARGLHPARVGRQYRWVPVLLDQRIREGHREPARKGGCMLLVRHALAG